jgi:hypothetical protein
MVGMKITPRFRDGIGVSGSRNSTLNPDFCDYDPHLLLNLGNSATPSFNVMASYAQSMASRVCLVLLVISTDCATPTLWFRFGGRDREAEPAHMRDRSNSVPSRVIIGEGEWQSSSKRGEHYGL